MIEVVVTVLLILVLTTPVTSLMPVSPTSSIANIYDTNYKGPSPHWYDPIMHKHACYLIESYNKLSGKELVDMNIYKTNPLKATNEMFLNMNRIVLSHGVQKDGAGPILNYGNSAGLKLFSASWDQLTQMPSRYTADTETDRELRQQFMDEVTKNNIVSNYQGIRISLDKKKFLIKEAVVWNIVINDQFFGQAATFDKYEYI